MRVINYSWELKKHFVDFGGWKKIFRKKYFFISGEYHKNLKNSSLGSTGVGTRPVSQIPSTSGLNRMRTLHKLTRY